MDVTDGANGKSYASKGVGGTALGLGIAGTALGLLNGGLGLFGSNKGADAAQTQEIWNKIADNRYEAQGNLYNYALAKADQRFMDAQFVNGQMFGMYRDMRDRDDRLQREICDLKTKLAVVSATTPLQIANASQAASYQTQLEAAKRAYGDAIIVTYVNGEFMPLEIASVTTGDTATAKPTFNPLANL